MSQRLPDDLRFRSLAAPDLDEDELFVALQGMPGAGALWGEGRPWARPDPDAGWDPERERRRRHEALLRKWEGGGAAGIPGLP